MQRESKKYLFDIQRAARLIGEFSADKTFADYMRDPMLRAAVEREFTIIGEAMSQLARLDEAVVSRITDSSRIIAFRNVLVHGYTTVDSRLVWQAVIEDLPALIGEVETLLAED
ncbi:MAG: DUF86 domain-containing protein [Dehalococcoidia bacterium]|nr:DUF86 domain-containing protein [Dehalococcoidia bacterium]MYI86000.1 DUF86 domain-containing protein [Dehalococcoidia bacterium]